MFCDCTPEVLSGSLRNELFCRCFVQIQSMTLRRPTFFPSFLWRWAFLFFTLYVVTLTFDYYLFAPVFDSISVPFRWLAEFTGELFFGVTLLGAGEFYSDSLIVFVHVFNLVLLSFLASLVWTFFSKQKFTETKLYPVLFTVLRYFLALHLLVYGFSKLYKWQFMLPEPNLLYTNVGDMHRDILYWTSMGTSRSYSVFMGVIEIVPAILLLFRRTTLVGALLSVMVLLNVVAVNFGFDITVKLHSMTLLLMSLVLLIPAWKGIVALLTGRAAEDWEYPALKIVSSKKWISPVVKVAVILLLVMEAHYPYTITQTFNDDAAERPPMHGAYEVFETKCIRYDSTGKCLENTTGLWQRFFINRRGYLIFETEDGELIDYALVIDTVNHVLIADREIAGENDRLQLRYEKINDSTYAFTDPLDRKIYTAHKVDLSKLPLLEEEFTWIDED